MRDTFIKVPFAEGGDKTPIPNATQPDGSISMQQGWGVDYEKEVGVDPAAKPVGRQSMNQILNISTALLNRWQTETFPEWIDSAANDGAPFVYPIGAVVRYSSDGIAPYLAWVNLVASNGTSPSIINGWALLSDVVASYRDPTESVRGMPLVATQAETNAGTNDAKAVTPKKLRAGFDAIISINGYITFPTWLGGLIIEWGQANVANNATVAFPLSFPVGPRFVTAIHGPGATNNASTAIGTVTQSNFVIRHSLASAAGFYFFAIGT